VGLSKIAVRVSAKTVLLLITGVLHFPTLSAQTMADAAKIPPSPAARPVPTLEERGDIYMVRKMYREAIDVYSQEPESYATRWNKIGIAYHQLQDLPAAKKSYERALKINPNFGEAINNLGTIYYAQKHYSKAVHQYKKAMKVLTQSPSLMSNLGTAYFAKRDYRRAGEEYQAALRLDLDVFEHHDSFGVMLEEHSVAERAKFHYYLAKMFAEQHLTDRALLYMRKSLEEGFSERHKFMEEPEFAGLRDSAEFQELMRSSPRVL
jgi:tetratricopeptide (TPR) repeat protein